MISAALTTRTTTVVMEGSAIIPDVLRFASIISQTNATIFKAGSTFIRHIMTSANTVDKLAEYQLPKQLRVATFCAEPVNTVVHQFAAKHICNRYINSYWGTEHGGIVWSTLNDDDQALVPDAHTRCMPWISGGVHILDEDRPPSSQERGDIVIEQAYPYLARTVWGEPDSVLDRNWRGDIARWATYFDGEGRFIQGDTAMQHEDQSYTFHGRSDEVINIGGNRYGNEQIENAALQALGKLVQNVVVVGLDDELNGIAPVAVVVPQDASTWDAVAAAHKVRDMVIAKVARYAVPKDLVLVSNIPCTFSGKYMRRLIRSLLMGEPFDPETDPRMGTIVNKDCIPLLMDEITAWRNNKNKRREVSSTDYVAPRTAEEVAMCEVWAQVLGISRVGVFDQFEALGGHSMLAMQIAIAASVSPAAILKYKTVADLVESMSNTASELADPADESELVWTPFPSVVSNKILQFSILTRLPASVVAGNAMLKAVTYHHITLPGGFAQDKATHTSHITSFFKAHPILTARAHYPSTDLHFAKPSDVDLSSHICNSKGSMVSEVSLEQLLVNIQGLYDRPLALVLVGPSETILVLHHLIYDAHSLKLLKHSWGQIVSGKVPVPVKATIYPAINAAVEKARDSLFTGSTGCDYFSAMCHQCFYKSAALPTTADPWVNVIRPLMDRALKKYTSSGEIYFELITDFRTGVTDLNAANVCGNLTGARVYHYDGQTFTKTDFGKCVGPRLVVNVVQRDQDETTENSNLILFAPLRRVIFVSLEPSCTSWLAPIDLLPDDVAANIAPIKVNMLQAVASHSGRIIVKYFKIPQLAFIGLDAFSVMQLWGIVQNMLIVAIALVIAFIWRCAAV